LARHAYPVDGLIMPAPAVIDSNIARQADLAKIHMAKKALGMADDAFLAHLAKCGWVDGRKAAAGSSRPVRKALTAPQKKMWSLWQQLADDGLVNNRKMPALLAYVQRQTQVDRLEWLKPAQEDLVIESLKRWLSRRSA